MMRTLRLAVAVVLGLAIVGGPAFAQSPTDPGGSKWKECRKKTGYHPKRNPGACETYQYCLGKLVDPNRIRNYCASVQR